MIEVFEEEDAELFFGRERLVEDLVNPVDVLDLVVAMLGNPLAGSGGQEDCGEGKGRDELNGHSIGVARTMFRAYNLPVY